MDDKIVVMTLGVVGAEAEFTVGQTVQETMAGFGDSIHKEFREVSVEFHFNGVVGTGVDGFRDRRVGDPTAGNAMTDQPLISSDIRAGEFEIGLILVIKDDKGVTKKSISTGLGVQHSAKLNSRRQRIIDAQRADRVAADAGDPRGVSGSLCRVW